MKPTERSLADSARDNRLPSIGNDTPGFTRIELLVVIATLAMLALTLLPALAKGRVKPQGTQCLSNFRQLATAWLMYANENNDACAGNNWHDEQSHVKHENWVDGWEDASLYLTDNTNTDLLTNPAYATLAEYTRNPLLFLCPASIVVVPNNSGKYSASLCRSVSMNCWMGYRCVPPGAVNGTPVNYSSGQAAIYKEFFKVTSITGGLVPTAAFVFIEERGESIDDASFETDMGGLVVDNWPADNHNGAATVAFADGHAESHRWRTAGFLQPQQQFVVTKWGSATVMLSQAQDLQWLQLHATCSK